MENLLPIILPLLALLIGVVLGWFLQQRSSAETMTGLKQDLNQLNQEQLQLREKLSNKEVELAAASEKNAFLDELKTKLDTEQQRVETLQAQLATSQQKNQDLEARLQEQNEKQQQELNELNKRFKTEFENLANRILDEKSAKFSEQNKESMAALLQPVQEQFKKFETSVQNTYEKGLKERTKLHTELVKLAELNATMQAEANNLTKALKGDRKIQGNWGEMILERLLEQSGLRPGQHFTKQESVTTEEGRRLQPDIIVQLPDDKKIVIDSKVSLVAYERYINAEDKEEQEREKRAHLTSVNSHIKGLASKQYENLYGLESLDFVLLFIPIESAFSLAIESNPQLFTDAFNKNIVVVTPSTLLATLKTISSIWKNEYRNRNVMDIADRGGKLYDKFADFVAAMEKLGDRLRQTQAEYDTAMNRLTQGSGNLLRQAEMLKKLGAKASKELPKQYLDTDE